MDNRTKSKATLTKSRRKAATWSRQVVEKSDATDLKAGVFRLRIARAIAQSLKKPAEASNRRKSTPFRSAMPIRNFESNRAGINLSAERLKVLNRAKEELR